MNKFGLETNYIQNMKKIIVPIDFSKDSLNALQHAIWIANLVDADIRIVHVTKTKNFEMPFYIENFDKMVGKSLKDFMEMIYKKYKAKVKNKLDYKIRVGKVYREIVNQAKYDDAYMIVMGTHGVSGFEEMWIGSNAYRVVSNAPCPVLTIRHGFLKCMVGNIVLPIDVSADTRKKVPFSTEIAKYLKSTVHVLLVTESNSPTIKKKVEGYGKQVVDYLKKSGVKYVLASETGDNLTDVTIEYANTIGADMISIMSEQSSTTSNLWLGAYAQQMVNHSPLPVLCHHFE